MKKIIEFFKKLFNYSYCDDCGWTQDPVTHVLGKHSDEYPIYKCQKCIDKHNLKFSEMKKVVKKAPMRKAIAKKAPAGPPMAAPIGGGGAPMGAGGPPPMKKGGKVKMKKGGKC